MLFSVNSSADYLGSNLCLITYSLDNLKKLPTLIQPEFLHLQIGGNDNRHFIG